MKRAVCLSLIMILFFVTASVGMATEMTKESRLGPQMTLFPDPEAVAPPKINETKRKPKNESEKDLPFPFDAIKKFPEEVLGI